jgi:hypothetical protein
MAEICSKLDISYPKLIKEFDKVVIAEGVQISPPAKPLNLLIDATFFGREYGYLCFHDTHQIIYFHEIKTENTADLRSGLIDIKEAGFRIKSVTIDGRRGYIRNIRKILGPVPIQMCIFHQKMIVRRYITDKPQSACGKDLKMLMETLCHADPQKFIDRFYGLAKDYNGFLQERNDKGGFKHQKIRAAFRSMHDNMHMVFTYKDIPSANIPSTTSQLEGLFSHLKLNIAIHRGLTENRKKNAVKFFLNSF